LHPTPPRQTDPTAGDLAGNAAGQTTLHVVKTHAVPSLSFLARQGCLFCRCCCSWRCGATPAPAAGHPLATHRPSPILTPALPVVRSRWGSRPRHSPTHSAPARLCSLLSPTRAGPLPASRTPTRATTAVATRRGRPAPGLAASALAAASGAGAGTPRSTAAQKCRRNSATARDFAPAAPAKGATLPRGRWRWTGQSATAAMALTALARARVSRWRMWRIRGSMPYGRSTRMMLSRCACQRWSSRLARASTCPVARGSSTRRSRPRSRRRRRRVASGRLAKASTRTRSCRPLRCTRPTRAPTPTAAASRSGARTRAAASR
jgi:hypothetical protein